MKKYLRYLGPVLITALFVLAIYLLYHKLKAYSIAQIRESIQQVSTGSICFSIGLMIVNYIILVGYGNKLCAMFPYGTGYCIIPVIAKRTFALPDIEGKSISFGQLPYMAVGSGGAYNDIPRHRLGDEGEYALFQIGRVLICAYGKDLLHHTGK